MASSAPLSATDPPSEEPRRLEWRAGFQRRLRKALVFMQGNVTTSHTQSNHYRCFARTVSENDTYKREIEKLSPFELEILCISSTDKQLKRDLEYFTASEVVDALAIQRVNNGRRTEVRHKILRNSAFEDLGTIYNNSVAHETLLDEERRVVDMKEWITHTLNTRAIQRLANELVAHLQGEVGVEPAGVSTAPISASSSEDGIPEPFPLPAIYPNRLGPSTPETRPQKKARAEDNPSDMAIESSSPGLSSVETDSQTLLRIIYLAGGRVPMCFFHVAWTWNEAGEPTRIDDPDAPAVLRDEAQRQAAIDYLLSKGHLVEVTDLYDSEREFLIHPETSLCRGRENLAAKWKKLAVLAVCRAFPRWPHVSARLKQCKSLLPILARLLSYEPELEDGSRHRSALVEVCISASYFGSTPWKRLMIDTAARIIPQDSSLKQRLHLRTSVLNRLESIDEPMIEAVPSWPDQRSRAYLGEQVVFELRRLLDQHAPLEKMQEQLARLNSLDLQKSTQGRQVWIQGHEFFAKALRYRGKSQNAVEWYRRLLEQWSRSDASLRFLASYAEALCEVGESGMALTLLRLEPALQRKTGGPRLELAVAHAYLTKVLWNYHAGRKLQEVDKISLDEAQYRYHYYKKTFEREGIPLSITNKYNHFVCCAGLAMIQHISALPTSEGSGGLVPETPAAEERTKMQAALAAWKCAQDSAPSRWQEPAFDEVVTLYSQSELAYRLGHDDAGVLAESARQIYLRTGRRYFFVAHGTVWLEILDQQAERSGRARMALSHNES